LTEEVSRKANFNLMSLGLRLSAVAIKWRDTSVPSSVNVSRPATHVRRRCCRWLRRCATGCAAQQKLTFIHKFCI